MSSLHLKATFHFSLTCSDTAPGKAGENISYIKMGEFLTCWEEALPAESPVGLRVPLPLSKAAAPWIPHWGPAGKPHAHWQEPWASVGVKTGSTVPQEKPGGREGRCGLWEGLLGKYPMASKHTMGGCS